jgi:hypothetical protein
VRRLLLIFLFIGLTSGCAVLRGTKANTASQNAIVKQEKKALDIDKDIKNNIDQQIKHTAAYAYGVNYSLNRVQDPSIEVITANRMNDRIVSIVGSPEIKEGERIRKIVDYLNSEISHERAKGEKALIEKDKEISDLQKQKEELEKKYDTQITKLIDQAKDVAKKSDEKQTTLDSMSGLMGLNAVFWGLKKFFFTSLTWIVIFAIIFLILRIASATNPIAAAAFSIFNIIGSFIINLFKGLTPQAFNLCNLVKTNDMLKYKIALTKIIDVVEEFKLKEQQKEGDDFSVNDFLTKLSIDMDQSDKNTVNEILIEQKWKKN